MTPKTPASPSAPAGPAAAAAAVPRPRRPVVRNGWPARWVTPVPDTDLRRGDGELYEALINATCRVTKESVAAPAGQLLVMRPWQRQVLRHVYARRADGRLRHRVALVGIARKNGKSGLGAGMGIGGMLLGDPGGEVYSAAATKDQAKIVFDVAKKMVELDSELSEIIKVYRDALEIPETGTFYKALSAEAFTKDGLNPSKVIFDEVHAQPTRELWDVLAEAQGARVEPLQIGITTAGVKTGRDGGDSLCYQLYKYGVKIAKGEITDPTFFMAWWEPWDGPAAPHTEVSTWREGNPGYGDLVNPEDFASVVQRTPENTFRTKRCNQWVASAKVWLPSGVWDARADPARYPGGPPDGTRVVIGFDGSKSGDSTVLIGITVEKQPHIFVVGMWEKDADDASWRVPRGEVKAEIRKAARRWDVVEFPWDDFLWQDAKEELQDEGHPIEPFPQTPERMGKATQRFEEEAIEGGFTHDGDPRLARHVENAVPKQTAGGMARIVKPAPDSPLRIDGAVTAVFTLDRAAWWALQDDDGPNIW